MNVCQYCFGNSTVLVDKIMELGEKGTCDTCESEEVYVVEAGKLSDLFEGLKSYYLPLIGDPYRLGKEGVYGIGENTGDETLVEILRYNWEVFSDRISDEQAEEILAEVWPGFTGDYMWHPPNRRREVIVYWQSLKNALMSKWRFFLHSNEVEDSIPDFFAPWLGSLKRKARQTNWFRARIQAPDMDPFTKEEMLAPPPEKATAGRANSAGIPHLYLASDENTAVAEVRAEPGDWVTVACVTLQEGMDILDLSNVDYGIDPFAYAELDETIMVRNLLLLFASELSRPIRPVDQERDYICTQYISEYFRRNQFGGIVYPSTMTSGVNAVIFDPASGLVSGCYQMCVKSKTVEIVKPHEYKKQCRRL